MSPLFLVFLLVGTTLCAPVPGKKYNEAVAEAVASSEGEDSEGFAAAQSESSALVVSAENEANDGENGSDSATKDVDDVMEDTDGSTNDTKKRLVKEDSDSCTKDTDDALADTNSENDDSDAAINNGEKQVGEDFGTANGASNVDDAVKSIVKGKLGAAKDGSNAVGDISKGDVGGTVKDTKGAVSDMVKGDKGAVGALLDGEQKASDGDEIGAETGAADDAETGAENEAITGTDKEEASKAEKEVSDVDIDDDTPVDI